MRKSYICRRFIHAVHCRAHIKVYYINSHTSFTKLITVFQISLTIMSEKDWIIITFARVVTSDNIIITMEFTSSAARREALCARLSWYKGGGRALPYFVTFYLCINFCNLTVRGTLIPGSVDVHKFLIHCWLSAELFSPYRFYYAFYSYRIDMVNKRALLTV